MQNNNIFIIADKYIEAKQLKVKGTEKTNIFSQTKKA